MRLALAQADARTQRIALQLKLSRSDALRKCAVSSGDSHVAREEWEVTPKGGDSDSNSLSLRKSQVRNPAGARAQAKSLVCTS